MDFSLKLLTAPSVEPVTVVEVKLHTRISYSQEDDILENWIYTARILAENFQRRAYVTQKWRLFFDKFPALPILIPRPPLDVITNISYYDTDDTETVLYSNDSDPSVTTTTSAPPTVTDDGTFIIDTYNEPGRLGFGYVKSWPSVVLRPHNAVKIDYWAGYGPTADDVQQNVKDAIMLYCAYRNENRAGEVAEAPKQFYDLLMPEKIFTP